MLPHPFDVVYQTVCADHYRELAVDTLARSETAASQDVRTHYFLLAAYWYERALECERDPEEVLPH
jgi:hypothetical protein